MRTAELLELYKQGNRDFRNQDLRGKSFVGQDLSGVNLSGSDLRGTDFTNAILQNVNFTGVRAGLLPAQKITILVASVLASLLLGGLAGWVDALVELEFHNSDGFGGIAPSISAKWIVLIILLVFGYVTQRHGMVSGFSTFTVALAVAVVGAFISTSFVSIAAAIVIAITVVAFIAVVTTIIVILSLTAALAINVNAGAIVLAAFTPTFAWVAVPSAGESAVILAIAVTLLSAYISWRTYLGDNRHTALQSIATGFATRNGTNFRGADLTSADFSQARLQGANFNDAIF
ncbi:MAG: pentapeptide repeat-containing protein [Leptolyngbyaceae cyanobacterium CSU_1_4]|nr:pentapeptide repeat-containing protein [Leptolyngbyaceae cyanobacterium CSU_1_4]